MARQSFFSSMDLPENIEIFNSLQGTDTETQQEASEGSSGSRKVPDISPPEQGLVIWCGTSTGNAVMKTFDSESIDLNSCDSVEWENLEKDHKLPENLYRRFSENPHEYSPETRFLKIYLTSYSIDKVALHFFAEPSAASQLTRVMLERYYEEQGFYLYRRSSIPAYFRTPFLLDRHSFYWDPVRELSWLDELVFVGHQMRKVGRKTLFCAFGNSPIPYVLCAIAAYLTGSISFYFDAVTDKRLLFPYHFYRDRGDELDLLRKLAQKELDPELNPVVHHGFMNPYTWNRLLMYQLLQTSKDPDSLKVVTRLTPRG